MAWQLEACPSADSKESVIYVWIHFIHGVVGSSTKLTSTRYTARAYNVWMSGSESLSTEEKKLPERDMWTRSLRKQGLIPAKKTTSALLRVAPVQSYKLRRRTNPSIGTLYHGKQTWISATPWEFLPAICTTPEATEHLDQHYFRRLLSPKGSFRSGFFKNALWRRSPKLLPRMHRAIALEILLDGVLLKFCCSQFW